jgi:hypothetical protein
VPSIPNSLIGKPRGKPDGLISFITERERMIDVAGYKPETPATVHIFHGSLFPMSSIASLAWNLVSSFKFQPQPYLKTPRLSPRQYHQQKGFRQLRSSSRSIANRALHTRMWKIKRERGRNGLALDLSSLSPGSVRNFAL